MAVSILYPSITFPLGLAPVKVLFWGPRFGAPKPRLGIPKPNLGHCCPVRNANQASRLTASKESLVRAPRLAPGC